MIRANELAREWRLDPVRVGEEVEEALRLGRTNEPGGMSPDEFSLQDLAANFIMQEGRPIGMDGLHREFNPMYQTPVSMIEAQGAVDTTTFANITGQLIVNSVLAAYESDEFVASKAIPSQQTSLDGEKIPGVTPISDPGQDALVVREGQDYPSFGVGEAYVETPSTTKRGLLIPVTKEAIFFDRTGQLLDRASSVGETLGLNKEKRLLDAVIGGTKNYKRNGTTYWTYYSTNDTGAPWVNHLSGNELVDWTDVDNAEDLFTNMTNPDTSEPIVMTARHLLVPWQKRSVATRLLSATETRTGSNPIVVAGNPLAGLGLSLLASRLLYARLIATDSYGHSVDAADAKDYWFYGDLSKAFKYMQNWPISVTRAPANSEAEFLSDIVARFKASERGAAAIVEPRAISRNRKDATSSSSGS